MFFDKLLMTCMFYIQFAKFIVDTSNTILTNTFKYNYDSIEITNMWASKYEKGHYHALILMQTMYCRVFIT